MDPVKVQSRPANGHLVNGTGKPDSRNPKGLPEKLDDEEVYGKRLLPTVTDRLARSNPHKVHASIAVSADLSDGFRDVTVSEMVNGANEMAWRTQELFGISTSLETVSYLGISDLRYSIMVIAMMKCGYKIMVPSIRNSLSMNLALFRETKCDKVFYSQEVARTLHELKEERPSIVAVLMPSLEELLASRPHHFPYEKNFDDAEDDPVIICHTSGSTGDPKPITLTHGACSCWDGARHIPKVESRRNQDYALWNFDDKGGRFYSSFPPFHLAGLVNNTFLPIWYNTTVVLGPPDRPGTGQLVCEAMRHFSLKAVYCAPSILEQMCQEPGGLEQAKALDFAIFTGGPLAPAAGDALSQVTDLCQIYGSTETGVTPALVPLPQNWAYLEFNPCYNHVMEEVADGQFEMVLYQDTSLRRIRQINHTMPAADVWRTKDVFMAHPAEPNLWQFHGRVDDIMVLGNGEKFNPVPMEKIIEGHPLVHGALMVGQGRNQPALIVEAQHGVSVRGRDFVDAVWQIVQEANSKGPGHARITRDMIAVTDATKPFVRAGKGTIVRGRTVKAFEEDVEKLYSADNDQQVEDVPELSEPYDRRAIELFVRAAVQTYFPKDQVTVDDDIFVLGVDSLQSVELAARLRVGLATHPRVLLNRPAWLLTKTIYANPTISALAAEIDDRVNHDGNGPGESQTDEREDARVLQMSRIVEQYTRAILACEAVPRTEPRRPSRLTVVLTGSTGSLGVHLLEALLNNSKVARIYCFNRSDDALSRHEQNFASRGLSHTYDIGGAPLFFDASTVFYGTGSSLHPKVQFLKVDFGAADFSLSPPVLAELTACVDVVIHNAWKVDFLHRLASFEPVHIRGVCNFVEWSLRSPRRPHLVFVSSISSVGRWAHVYPGRRPVSETPHENYSVAAPLGYAESKHVAERVLTFAAERRGVPASILRVGQIAGPVARSNRAGSGNAWNETEWLPRLVRTSKSLGLVPACVPDINWIPVDRLARIVVELVHHRVGVETEVSSEVYNLVNPRFADWETLLGPLRARFAVHRGGGLRTVSWREWLDTLKTSVDVEDPKQVAEKPAIKILDFYEALAAGVDAGGGGQPLTYDTRNGCAASRTMARLPAVQAAWMETWLRQWDF